MWDVLTTEEGRYTQFILAELAKHECVRPLVDLINREGGLTAKNKPHLFEARFAYELITNGHRVEYEFKAGVGSSSVDFRVLGGCEWLIELVSICESSASKQATLGDENLWVQHLSTLNDDRRLSEEREMILVGQKIGEKALIRDSAHKFPVPSGAYHVIVADVRGYLDGGGDVDDWRQIALGASALPPDLRWKIHFWDDKPIAGLFEKNNPIKSSRVIRERVHFLCFVCEKSYRQGEIGSALIPFANPHLFSSAQEASKAWDTWPLPRSPILDSDEEDHSAEL